MTGGTLLAPLDGWALPLAEVADPVFADGLAGDGVAIDPTGDLVSAPCAGEVLWPARAPHAVSLRTATGLTVLVHVGIDTVGLDPGVFRRLVEPGAQVAAGEALLRFDLDAIARRARSAVTPIVLGTDGAATITSRVLQRAVRAGEPLLEWRAAAPAEAAALAAVHPAPGAAAAPGSPAPLRRRLRVPFDHGLHARPAALIAAALRGFAAQARASVHGRSANLRSVTALMTLGAQRGDTLEVVLQGEDAPAALAALERLLAAPAAAGARASAYVAPRALAQHGDPDPDPDTLRGVPAVRGIAVGIAVHWVQETPPIADRGAGYTAEHAALQAALATVRERLRLKAADAPPAQHGILAAHGELLGDPQLMDLAEPALRSEQSAGRAWRAATAEVIGQWRALGDARIAERAADLADLEIQVLRALAGLQPDAAPELPEHAVLIAVELLPSQLLDLDLRRVAGIAMAYGGATSHVAILAAAHGIPLLVAIGSRVLEVAAGASVILDADRGLLLTAPTEELLRSTSATLERRALADEADLRAAQAPCATADGIAIAVHANLGSLEEARLAISRGADGCGLLRTEFLFLDRAQAPDEDEQAECYQRIAAALDGRPLAIRTLDAGGDKPLPYLPLPPEENPALGLRGIRTSLHDPQLLQTQLRAILRVAPPGQCRILLPMIDDLGEVRAVRAALAEACRALGVGAPPRLGAMIETPAAALLAGQLATEVDFFSIGTNDLSQYTLAIDRGHAELAAKLDALHPAVLSLIQAAAAAGRRHGRPVAVCGGLASDPEAVPLLIGLGIHELSAVPALIPRLKGQIRTLHIAQCEQLAAQALGAIDAAAVRALARDFHDRRQADVE